MLKWVEWVNIDHQIKIHDTSGSKSYSCAKSCTEGSRACLKMLSIIIGLAWCHTGCDWLRLDVHCPCTNSRPAEVQAWGAVADWRERTPEHTVNGPPQSRYGRGCQVDSCFPESWWQRTCCSDRWCGQREVKEDQTLSGRRFYRCLLLLHRCGIRLKSYESRLCCCHLDTLSRW